MFRTEGGFYFIMDYNNYKQSRNLTWKILISQNVRSLPIRISDICKSYNITLSKFSKNKASIEKLKCERAMHNNDGFNSLLNGEYVIFYDDSKSQQRCRFTVAHELGHILLGHTGKYDLINHEPSEKDNPIEQAANVFASRLLAPACVLWGLNARTPEEIMKYCDITYTAAQFRAERMEQLYQREKDFIKSRGKSCFLLSPLERQVYNQFEEYIKDRNRFQKL